MGDLSGRNFGIVIAYLIPGFTVLWGLSHVSEPVRAWLLGAGAAGPSVGSALYVALASLGCGMTASLFRWLLVDTLHHRTGVVRPVLDETRLPERLAAFDYLVENHYRYYQFYGNSAVALTTVLAAWGLAPGPNPTVLQVSGVLVVTGAFILGSRDALVRYYSRSALLLGIVKGSSHDERQPPHHDQQNGGGAQVGEPGNGGKENG